MLGGTGYAKYPYIVMGAADDGNAYISVSTSVFPDTNAARNQAILAVIRNDGTTMVESPALSDVVNLSFTPALLSFDTYTLAYGIDLDGNGHLDPNERFSDTRWQFRVASRSLYTTTKAGLLTGALVPGILFPYPNWPTASEFLIAFINDNAGSISEALPQADIVSVNELDENVGALFTGSGTAAVVHIYFSKPSAIYTEVLDSEAMYDAARYSLSLNEAGIRNLMQSTSIGGTQDFTFQLYDSSTQSSTGMEFKFTLIPPTLRTKI